MAVPLYNGKFILLISFTFITIFSAIAIYFCLPILISHVIRSQLSLSPSSGSFNDWRLNYVTDRFYLYNITNYEEISNEVATRHSGGKSQTEQSTLRLKIQEVGPFTFRQEREKINIKFDVSNETVLYDQVKRWTFMPELSLIKTVDGMSSSWINHVSIPLAGTTLNAEYSEFIDPIVSENDLKLFMKHSVNTLLFEGYHDILMESAKGSGQIDVDRFGWLYNQNNSITAGIRVFTGPSNATLDKFGLVDSWKNGTNFNVWHNNNTDVKDTNNVKCNQFRLSSAGEFFPAPKGSIISHTYNADRREDIGKGQAFDLSNQIDVIRDVASVSNLIDIGNKFSMQKSDKEDKNDRVISLFMPDLCRVFKLSYKETIDYRGLTVDRYIANRYTYSYNHKSSNETDGDENKCYCTYSESTKMTQCPPNGMMDIFNCRKGSPLTISFPHFLFSSQDPTLAPYLELFQMENNDQKNVSHQDSDNMEHLFYMDLESTLNLPVRAQVAIQFNVHYRNEASLNFTKDYSFLMQQGASTTNSSRVINDLYLPQMWFKSSAEIDDRNLESLKFIQNRIKLVSPIVTILMFCCASILLTMSARLAYNLTYGHLSRTNKSSLGQDQESCGSMSGNEDSLIDQKQKCYPMQLAENMYSNDSSFNKPTSSRVVNCGDLDVIGLESQPLNQT